MPEGDPGSAGGPLARNHRRRQRIDRSVAGGRPFVRRHRAADAGRSGLDAQERRACVSRARSADRLHRRRQRDRRRLAGGGAAALSTTGDVAAVGRDYSSPTGGTWVQRLYDGFRRHPDTVAAGSMAGDRQHGRPPERGARDRRLRRDPRDLRGLRFLQPAPLARLRDPGRPEAGEHPLTAIRQRSTTCSRASCGAGGHACGSACAGCNSWSELPSIAVPDHRAGVDWPSCW